MKILSVVGARPNFMKIAPFVAELDRIRRLHDLDLSHVLVHTGQHYDPSLSDRFFEELGIPAPTHHLEVGSGTHAYQVGMTMIKFEPVLLEERPDWVIVVGDVNAACACSLTAKKHQFRVAHIEAGLRSNDWSMPEEINRVVTDRLSDLLFTTCDFSGANLRAEGVAENRIVKVGNIMIDTLKRQEAMAAGRDLAAIVREHLLDGSLPDGFQMTPEQYGLLTLHRPSNVDSPETLSMLVDLIVELSGDLDILFPVHPRTLDRLKQYGLKDALQTRGRVVLLNPLGYLDMLALTRRARIFLTDSGGIQEECCIVGTPCLTLRSNTERPATLAEHGGTNYLVGNDPERVRAAFHSLRETPRQPRQPPLWDGQTAARIVDRLVLQSDQS